MAHSIIVFAYVNSKKLLTIQFIYVFNNGMRNKITKKAIAKAGGVDALARKLKIKQPSVSAWYRVPPGRCIEVEKITGISRHELRPDIFGKAA